MEASNPSQEPKITMSALHELQIYLDTVLDPLKRLPSTRKDRETVLRDRYRTECWTRARNQALTLSTDERRFYDTEKAPEYIDFPCAAAENSDNAKCMIRDIALEAMQVAKELQNEQDQAEIQNIVLDLKLLAGQADFVLENDTRKLVTYTKGVIELPG